MTAGSARPSPRFASPRERRLWLWTMAVVVAIFSTVGLARTLADELRSRDLLDGAFVFAFGLILVAIVALALRLRPGGVEVGVALGVVAVYLLVFVRMGIPDERTHLIEYGVVAILIHEALKERAGQGPAGMPALMAIVAASAIGVIDEGIQAVLPSRVFDLRDIGFNLVAAVLAVGAALALERARRRTARPR